MKIHSTVAIHLFVFIKETVSFFESPSLFEDQVTLASDQHHRKLAVENLCPCTSQAHREQEKSE